MERRVGVIGEVRRDARGCEGRRTARVYHMFDLIRNGDIWGTKDFIIRKNASASCGTRGNSSYASEAFVLIMEFMIGLIHIALDAGSVHSMHLPITISDLQR
jgi:hypothetical protein